MSVEFVSTELLGSDEVLAKEVADTLYKLYPKFLWIVEIPDHNVVLRLGDAVQNGWCYFINRKDIPFGSPEKFRKMCMRAGGEMLERLRIERKAKEDGQEFGFFIGSEEKINPTAEGLKLLKGNNQIIVPGKL